MRDYYYAAGSLIKLELKFPGLLLITGYTHGNICEKYLEQLLVHTPIVKKSRAAH